MRSDDATVPEVSIIIPVHNEERFIDEMLTSIANQTLSNWEAILVNDGSTDRTAEIIEQWRTRDSRIQLINPRKKLGKVAAFNLAHKSAAGDYICHVGGDDALPANSLQLRVDALRTGPPLTLALGKLQFIDETGQHIGSPIPHGPKGSQSSPGATYTRQLADIIFPIPPSLPSEDIWLGNAGRACASYIHHIPHVITNYRRHRGNSNPRWKSYEEMNHAIAIRMRAHELLVESSLPIPDNYRDELRQRVKMESLRVNRKTARILLSRKTRVIDRLALASMSNPILWRLRQRAGHRASGWRGR